VYAAVMWAVGYNGIIVVEPAGNGAQNLDDPTVSGQFPQPWDDTGAIIVGAGTAYSGVIYPGTSGCTATFPPRQWLSGVSSYGSRVNLQGWGECVVTSGYGDLYPPQGSNNANSSYTMMFKNTSGAAPIVAGAAASLSSVAQGQ